jgi:hypothetical protein
VVAVPGSDSSVAVVVVTAAASASPVAAGAAAAASVGGGGVGGGVKGGGGVDGRGAEAWGSVSAVGVVVLVVGMVPGSVAISSFSPVCVGGGEWDEMGMDGMIVIGYDTLLIDTTG